MAWMRSAASSRALLVRAAFCESKTHASPLTTQSHIGHGHIQACAMQNVRSWHASVLGYTVPHHCAAARICVEQLEQCTHPANIKRSARTGAVAASALVPFAPANLPALAHRYYEELRARAVAEEQTCRRRTARSLRRSASCSNRRLRVASFRACTEGTRTSK